MIFPVASWIAPAMAGVASAFAASEPPPKLPTFGLLSSTTLISGISAIFRMGIRNPVILRDSALVKECLLEQRMADSHGRPAFDLAFQLHRIHHNAGIHRDGALFNHDPAGIGVP
jgi:hypothetical protein